VYTWILTLLLKKSWENLRQDPTGFKANTLSFSLLGIMLVWPLIQSHSYHVPSQCMQWTTDGWHMHCSRGKPWSMWRETPRICQWLQLRNWNYTPIDSKTLRPWLFRFSDSTWGPTHQRHHPLAVWQVKLGVHLSKRWCHKSQRHLHIVVYLTIA
jgi:hypothetical protein